MIGGPATSSFFCHSSTSTLRTRFLHVACRFSRNLRIFSRVSGLSSSSSRLTDTAARPSAAYLRCISTRCGNSLTQLGQVVCQKSTTTTLPLSWLITSLSCLNVTTSKVTAPLSEGLSPTPRPALASTRIAAGASHRTHLCLYILMTPGVVYLPGRRRGLYKLPSLRQQVQGEPLYLSVLKLA